MEIKTEILIVFITSLLLSLFLTPLAGRLGFKFRAIDHPGERKVHLNPTPRTGGLAIFVTFVVGLIACRYFVTDFADFLPNNFRLDLFFLGAALIFGVGLWDDFKRLGPWTKLFVQIIGASIAYFGGVRITNLAGFMNIDLQWVGYIVTIFWFTLFINAINLVDGLDGLAAGLVCFTSLVMAALGLLKQNYFAATLFAVLAGSVMGFLRYNFNPATIFLGDGGSYLLGYLVAGLSALTSLKTNVGATMLIPLLALGIPVFDALLSPVRRFIRGQEMFMPDNRHIHHRLLAMGLTTKKAVWLIYAISICLCATAIFLVNLRDEQSGLILILLAAGSVLFIRKLGYLDYLASDKMLGWFQDVTDSVGVSREKRGFLNIQIEINRAENCEQLWTHLIDALEMLNFDRCDLKLNGFCQAPGLFEDGEAHILRWNRMNGDSHVLKRTLRIDLPLVGSDKRWFGNLVLEKDVTNHEIGHYTLKRVEHLRRNIIKSMEKFDANPPQNHEHQSSQTNDIT